MRECYGEEGVSEMVAVILLVGLTVLGVAVVATIFLSDLQPDEIPHAAIVVGNSSSGKLALTHEGGDPLRVGEYRIYVSIENELQDRTVNFTKPEDGAWSIGETLVYNGPGTPDRAVVTAISGAGETVLTESTFVVGRMTLAPD